MDVKLALDQHKRLISSLHVKIDGLHRKIDRLERAILESRCDAVADRWTMIDGLAAQLPEKNAQEVYCPICAAVFLIGSVVEKVSYCRFGGGKLVRYECPQCGAIVGPVKILNLSSAELSAEYARHYRLYSEGDASFSEEDAFKRVECGIDKVYLDWGGGIWSSTLPALRKKGYVIYNYEPYSASNVDDPYLITSLEKLKDMRFDGIFSNNLLEHLCDPLAEFRRMRSLLRTETSLMAHSTPCFDYAYEYTRFHVVFYTGNSPSVLADRTGFEYRGRNRVEGSNGNFSYTAVFAVA